MAFAKPDVISPCITSGRARGMMGSPASLFTLLGKKRRKGRKSSVGKVSEFSV